MTVANRVAVFSMIPQQQQHTFPTPIIIMIIIMMMMMMSPKSPLPLSSSSPLFLATSLLEKGGVAAQLPVILPVTPPPPHPTLFLEPGPANGEWCPVPMTY